MKNIDIAQIAQEDAIVKSMVSDLAGGFKEIIFPSRYLPELIESGIAYDGSSFQGINKINQSDAILQGVEESIVAVPELIADTEKPEYWIICNILDTNGKTHSNCARGKLIELQKKLAKVWDGGVLFTGAEPEAYFVKRKEKVGGISNGQNANYFNPKDPKSFIITEIQNILDQMGFHIERSHTEVGMDQFEINWRFDRAERTADRIQMYKIIVHKVARLFEYDVTFIPKPYPDRNGSGMHMHLSVGNDKKNLFYDETAQKYKYFSEKSRSFLTGIMNHAQALCAIANRAEVSYSRLVPGFEAPCVMALGDCNRSSAARIPAIADPKVLSKAIRTEFRFPDPLANPYLLSAGFIAVGLDGIEKEIEFPGFCEENLYACSLNEIEKKGYDLLPRTLWEAYKSFKKNLILKKQLGEPIFEAYKEILLDEIDSCQPFANTESIRRHYLA